MLKILEIEDANIKVKQLSSIEYTINSKGVWSAKVKVYGENEKILSDSSSIMKNVETILIEKNKGGD